MDDILEESKGSLGLRDKLKALGNRYAAEILRVLNPSTGDIISRYGWDLIVQGILQIRGVKKPRESTDGRSQAEVTYEQLRKKLTSGGTLYESMSKLVKVGFVQAVGEKRKKQRSFMITREGRLAIVALDAMHVITEDDTEVQRAAKILLKHKNFVKLLPAQDKFIEEIGEVDSNLVIQMPPGSGKTFLAMIIILMKLQQGSRCLYLTPYIALNRQIMDEYEELFENLGYSVVRHDGQMDISSEVLENANLVIAIHESFLSAKLQGESWTKEIGLAVVDELTELDSAVGPPSGQDLGTDRSTKLDTLVSLLKREIQVVTLSSRFGETGRVASWLDAKVFRPKARIVPDEFIVEIEQGQVGIVSSDGSQVSQLPIQDPLEAVINHLEDYDNKSVLIVVGARLRAEGIALFMANNHPRNIGDLELDTLLDVNADTPAALRLKIVLEKGIAFHHAGLTPNVRADLERMIKQGQIRTVVSTTGITSGTSFPFDSVIILFERSLAYRTSRAKYLQIAGRIGEYHLAEHGGSVYLILEEPSRIFPDASSLGEVLLHQPLKPLKPGPLFPELTASLMSRKLTSGRAVNKKSIIKDLVDVVENTYRGFFDPDYVIVMSNQASKLIDWFVAKGMFELSNGGAKLSKEAKIAVLSGLNLIEFTDVYDQLAQIDENANDDTLIDLILQFSLPQVIRPRTTMPSDFELELMGLEPPEKWYLDRMPARNDVKRDVLRQWINEMSVDEIVKEAHEAARGIGLDEGDLRNFVSMCSTLLRNLASFFKTMKKKNAAVRLERFSNRLCNGVKEDLAETDLFEILLPQEDLNPPRKLSREEVRVLIDNGYGTVKDVVRKDIDPNKPGLARDRFAKKCGFDRVLAKMLYRSALAHYKARRAVE